GCSRAPPAAGVAVPARTPRRDRAARGRAAVRPDAHRHPLDRWNPDRDPDAVRTGRRRGARGRVPPRRPRAGAGCRWGDDPPRRVPRATPPAIRRERRRSGHGPGRPVTDAEVATDDRARHWTVAGPAGAPPIV